MTTKQQIERLERALCELASGVDWSPQRGGRRVGALNAILAEQETVRAQDARQQRRAAIESELAQLDEVA